MRLGLLISEMAQPPMPQYSIDLNAADMSEEEPFKMELHDSVSLPLPSWAPPADPPPPLIHCKRIYSF
jgi:hypothetical protein